MTWRHVLAIGLVLRSIAAALLVPAVSLPMLVTGIVISGLVAYGVIVGNRLALGFGIYGAAMGVTGFLYAGTFPNPEAWYLLGAASLALTAVGILAWRTRSGLPTPP